MTEFMNGKEIAFRQHIINVKNLTEMIHDFDCIFKSELALLDESPGSVDSNRDAFSMVSSCFSECFNVLEFTKCIRQKLKLVRSYGKVATGESI